MVPASRFSFPFAGRVLEMVWLLAIGFVLLAVTPGGVQRATNEVAGRFAMSLLAGFVLLVVVPAAAALLLVTVIGIPLAAVVMLLYFATLYPAQVFVSAWLGDRILRARRRAAAPVSPYLGMTLGVVALAILLAVPFAGWIVRLVAVLTGFGALWATVWRARARYTG
jgi:hypothetical protein